MKKNIFVTSRNFRKNKLFCFWMAFQLVNTSSHNMVKFPEFRHYLNVHGHCSYLTHMASSNLIGLLLFIAILQKHLVAKISAEWVISIKTLDHITNMPLMTLRDFTCQLQICFYCSLLGILRHWIWKKMSLYCLCLIGFFSGLKFPWKIHEVEKRVRRK